MNRAFADAMSALQAGKLNDAARLCKAVLRAEPQHVEAHNLLGHLLGRLGRNAQAVASFDRALAVDPDSIEAWYGHGMTLVAMNRPQQAIKSFERVVAAKPDFTQVQLLRARLLMELGRHDAALQAVDQFIAKVPNSAEAWFGRSNVLFSVARHDEALSVAERALALRPDFAEAWQARDCGRIYTQLGQLDKALNAYDRALALNEDVKYAKGDRLYVKLQLSDWTNLDAEISDVIASVRTLQTPTAPFEFLAVSSSPEDQLQATKRCIANLTSLPAVWRGEIYAHDRIRVGYFSADFRDHPVAQLTAGMFEAHDKSRFETIALSLGPDDGSDLRRRIRSAFDDFADVRNLSDGDLAALIRRREIDILVDLTGFTHGGRFGVLARRIAPIQVNFPGYPGTTGADCVDYIIADPTVIPEDHFPYYSERVVWLPDSYQANDDKNPIPEGVPSRCECGLPETGFLFCCFNNTYKISPQIFDVWMRLLAATANSVLWLLGTNPTAAQNLRRGAERRGIAADRLIFAPRIAVADHLARHRQADLFLDTLPYNAHTTASDALRAGLPLVTCLGDTFAGRVAASVLRAIGLPELITTSLDEYEALAPRLAGDRALLAIITAKLAQNRKTYPLFDTARFTRYVESAYTTMWRRCQSGAPPAAFAVESEAE